MHVTTDHLRRFVCTISGNFV